MTDAADRFGTPLYVYSQKALLDAYDAVASAFAPLNPRVCFAIKSCHNLHLLRLLATRGASFDAVSIGEIRRAVEAGADPARIDFAGVGKTDAEIRDAIEAGVGWFNVESAAELAAIRDIAKGMHTAARVALRVMPDVDARTHPYITTGVRFNKFGIELQHARELFRQYRDDPAVRLAGVHMHIGSLIRSVDPYVEAITKVLALIDEIRADGCQIESLNIGGGYATQYGADAVPTPAEYAERIVPLLQSRDLEIHLEPGRCIAANAGILLTRVIYIKEQCQQRFVIVDAAMNDLLRPALYQAYHFIWPVEVEPRFLPPDWGEHQLPGTSPVDVVGPVCESSDFLARQRWLPPVQRGDLLAVFTTGAYGAVMASQYNSRTRAAEVLVSGKDLRLIRRRETYDDLVAAERDV